MGSSCALQKLVLANKLRSNCSSIISSKCMFNKLQPRQCPLAIPAAHPSHLRFSRVRSPIYHLRPLRFHLQKSPQLCQFKRNSILLTAAHSLFLFFFFLFFPRFFLFFFFFKPFFNIS